MSKYIKLLCKVNLWDKLEKEEVVGKCSVKKVFLKISQNSQEYIFARISFLMKFQASGLNLYWKRDSNTGVFLWIWWNFLRNLSLTNTYGYCFCTKGLFLQIFCKQKSFKHIVYNFTGLTSSNIRFCMTKSRVFIKKLFINPF